MRTPGEDVNVGATAGHVASQFMLSGPVRPEFARDETLAEIFAATVRLRGYRIAYASGDQVWTYAQVNELTGQMARALAAKGIGPGDVVGLWAPRGVALLMAQIAVTRTGAAWLPFDADAPVDRIAVCLADAGARGLLTCDSFAARARGAKFAVWSVETLQAEAAAGDLPDLPDPRARGQSADSPAYMIYTSGSTGAPKGIVISQRNICHFLRAANDVYGLTSDDVVFQGASVAFDLSMEEIWVPYLVGATLTVATPEVMSDIERLPDVLEAAGVTVLDTVPTLLALLPRDVRGLRVILLGGEALPAPLIARWARQDRRIFNTYGPTEATVVATVAEVVPGETVTIGKPIPNYTCYVVDEQLNPVAPGAEGELLIGGPGVAQGYLRRPELTAEKFIANPFATDKKPVDPVLYRSGDAVSLDATGNIVFHGRIDDQVKIRGFRVELGEIEAALADFPNVAQAAVVVRQDEGVDRLVAFLVAQPGQSIDRMALRAGLRERLPSYMCPSHFELATTLPRLTSGKIDRKTLKGVALTAREAAEEEAPQSDAEAVLLAAAKHVFPGQAIPFDADFFLDLGGHSLLAARFVSEVRRHPAYATLTMQDVYAARTLRAMAALVEANGGGEALDLSFEPPPLLRRFWCGLAQAVALPLILGVVTIQWLGLFLASIALLREDASIWAEMAALFTVYVALNIGAKLLIAGLKWAVLGRTKPGRYPLWGVYYFRVWFVQRMIQATSLKFLQNSPLMRVYLRMLGAKIGRDAIIGDFEAGAIDLITIGDGASTGAKNRFANVQVVGNELVIGAIDIGADAYTGNTCSFGPNSRVGRGAELADLTAIPENGVVGDGEKWEGSPARKTGMVDLAALPPQAEAGPARRAAQGAVYGVGYIVMLMLGLLPIFPAFYILYNLDRLFSGVNDHEVSWSMLPLLTIPTALALILVSMAVIIVCRWVILPRVRPGVYSIHSWTYVRKWLMGLATEVTLETLNSLYATLFMRIWYRLMGAKIGKGSEISTNLAGRYDLVDIGAGNFLGDEVIFGDEEIRRGYMELRTVKTGDRVFLGNDAIVPGGSVIEDGALLGIKSRMPEDLHIGENETWFGSPAIRLPVRQKFDVAANFTYQPPKLKLLGRGLFEAFHTSLPTALFITCGYMTADVIANPIGRGDWLTATGVFLAAGVVIALALVAFAAIVKWLMMGAYKPTAHPMWSWWAMRTEAVAVIYGGLVGKASLEFFRGTPFLPWLLRLYGTKIGKGVWMDWTDLTEFDCVKIGDYCAINMTSTLQTHLYEDRVMKVGRVELGKGVTVGAGSTVLYDTHVGDFARIGQTTVVMKGESLPAHSEWAGAPAQPVRRPQGDAAARTKGSALRIAA